MPPSGRLKESNPLFQRSRHHEAGRLTVPIRFNWRDPSLTLSEYLRPKETAGVFEYRNRYGSP
jgi:hypothetical protein